MTFSISDKVVCLRDDWLCSRCYTYPGQIPEAGKVYVVSGFSGTPARVGLQLVGCPVLDRYGHDWGFTAEAFRPLAECQAEARRRYHP